MMLRRYEIQARLLHAENWYSVKKRGTVVGAHRAWWSCVNHHQYGRLHIYRIMDKKTGKVIT